MEILLIVLIISPIAGVIVFNDANKLGYKKEESRYWFWCVFLLGLIGLAFYLVDREKQIQENKKNWLEIQQKEELELMRKEKNYCPDCDCYFNAEYKFCPKCGKTVMEHHSNSICPNCNKEIEKDCKFCPYCGKEIYISDKAVQKGIKEASLCQKCYKKIRSGAIGSLIFGVIALIMGFGDFTQGDLIVKILTLPLILLGLFLLIEGLIALIKPSPEAYILEGIAFILVGLWNIFIGVLSLFFAQVQAFFIILGVWQVVLGIKTFKEAKQFQNAINQLPDKSMLKSIEDLVKEIMSSKPKQMEEYVEFNAGTFTKTLQWKGKIAGDTLVLYSIPDENLRFLKRDEIELENKGKVVMGNSIKIEARIKEEPELQEGKGKPDTSETIMKNGGTMVKYSGTIPPESYERIVKWKESAVSGNSEGSEASNGENFDDGIIKAPF